MILTWLKLNREHEIKMDTESAIKVTQTIKGSNLYRKGDDNQIYVWNAAIRTETCPDKIRKNVIYITHHRVKDEIGDITSRKIKTMKEAQKYMAQRVKKKIKQGFKSWSDIIGPTISEKKRVCYFADQEVEASEEDEALEAQEEHCLKTEKLDQSCAGCERIFCDFCWSDSDVHYCTHCESEFCYSCGKRHQQDGCEMDESSSESESCTASETDESDDSGET